MNFVLDLLLMLLFAVGVILYLGNPYNVAFLVATLNSVFLIFPALIHEHFDPEFLRYSMQLLTFAISQPPYVEAKAWIVCLTIAWLLGAAIGAKVSIYSNTNSQPDSALQTKLSFVSILFLGAIAFVLFIYSARNLDISIGEIFLPARIQRGSHQISPYVEMTMLAIPTTIACLIVAARERVTFSFVFFALLAIVFSVSTAQRRTIILVIVTLVICYLISTAHDRKLETAAAHTTRTLRRIKFKVLGALVVLAPLGPLFWYARNYSTQVVRDSAHAIDSPFSVRSFGELFFGSPATGYPVTVLVTDMMRETTSSLLYSVSFLVSAPIPRAFWPDKPFSPDSVLENYYNIQFSPSLFIFPELIMNFMVMAPIFALLLAAFLSWMSRLLFFNSLNSGSSTRTHVLLWRIQYAIFFPQAGMMFKNGFTPFFINAAVWAFLAWIIVRICVARVFIKRRRRL